MEDALEHEIELYPFESFKILLDHEVNKSRRYHHPLTLIDIFVEALPQSPQTQQSAEVFVINALNLHVRDTDIPCKNGGEFLLLMSSTDEQGGRIACERLEKLFKITHQTYDRVSFQVTTFLGMASAKGNSEISSDQLMKQASDALQLARTRRIESLVSFSDIG